MNTEFSIIDEFVKKIEIPFNFNPFLKIRLHFTGIKQIPKEKWSLTFKFSSDRKFFYFLT